MAPTGAAKNEASAFLADDEFIFFTNDFQTINPAGWTSRERLEIFYRPEVDAGPCSDQIARFFGRILDAPPIEVARLLIEAGKNAREQIHVRCIAVGGRFGTNQSFRTVGGGLL